METALAVAREGIEKFPESGEMWNDYGVIQNQLGNPIGAVKSFEKALSLRDAPPETHQNLEDIRQEFASLLPDEIIERPVFICGTGRSGTTLLAMILDSHSNILVGPEIKALLPIAKLYSELSSQLSQHLSKYNFLHADLNISFRKLISSLFTKRNMRGRVVEHTPLNILTMSELISIFPDAQFLHIIRDGRDVVSSLLNQQWIELSTGKPFGPTENIVKASHYWKNLIVSAKEVSQIKLSESNYFEFKYEKLIDSQEETVRSILDFLGEPFESAVLEYHNHEHSFRPSTNNPQTGIYKSALGRWKNEFSLQDAQIFDSIAGDLLIELGYEENNDWVTLTTLKNTIVSD